MNIRNISKARTKAIKELQQLAKSKDPGYAHVTADRILCDFLKVLGYEDIVDEWGSVEKWYE